MVHLQPEQFHDVELNNLQGIPFHFWTAVIIWKCASVHSKYGSLLFPLH